MYDNRPARVVGGSSNTQLGLISAKERTTFLPPPGAILWRAGVKVSTCGVGVRNYPYSLRHTVARPVQWIARKMDIPNSIGNQPSVPLASYPGCNTNQCSVVQNFN